MIYTVVALHKPISIGKMNTYIVKMGLQQLNVRELSMIDYGLCGNGGVEESCYERVMSELLQRIK